MCVKNKNCNWECKKFAGLNVPCPQSSLEHTKDKITSLIIISDQTEHIWMDYTYQYLKSVTIIHDQLECQYLISHSFRFIMNYHRNCSASGMFVFIVYLVLWNCGTTIWFYAAPQQQRQYNCRCHCFVLSAVICYVEALGVYSVH